MENFAQNPLVQEEIDKIYPLLLNTKVGEMLAYDTATAVIGRDVRHEARYSLQKARQRVENDHGVRFGTVFGQGVKRLAANEVPAIGQASIRRIFKQAKKTSQRLTDLRGYNDMDAGDRLRIAAQRMVAEHVIQQTSRAALKKTEEGVKTAGAAIDFGSVLDKK